MIPRLVHPVQIELTQIDPSATPARDAQFTGEPAGSPVYLDPVRVTAQLGLGSTGSFRQRPGGDDPSTSGHVMVRVVDWRVQAPGRKLNKGDRITKLYAGTDQESDVQLVRWVVVEVRPAGHYRGGHALWMLRYTDMKNLSEVG